MNYSKSKKSRPANVLIILVLIVSMVAGYSAWTLSPFLGGSGAVYADTYRDTDVTTPGSGCVLAYVKCNFIPAPAQGKKQKLCYQIAGDCGMIYMN